MIVALPGLFSYPFVRPVSLKVTVEAYLAETAHYGPYFNFL